MSTPLPCEERQRIITNNRSLRTIKNELESLAERGAISDDIFDLIMSKLPAESSLNSNTSNRNQANRSNGNSSVTTVLSPSPAAVPSQAMNNLYVGNNPTPPPTNAAPTPTPMKIEIARARALYRYLEPGDCNFETGDILAVYEFMNPDWWLGKNLRTGQEGVFPQNYVQKLPDVPAHHGSYEIDKGNMYQNEILPPYRQQVQPIAQPPPGPPPSGPTNPYNSAVPPLQVAEQPTDSKMGKGGEMGKKFGKKLGNAAIFGAGATLGGNIVNSIF